jgi:hypothetical protein
MRQGPALEDRAQAAPILPISGIRRSEWSPNHYDVMPLPKLAAVAKRNGIDIDHRAWAADLRLCGPIETARLDVRQRVACLSEQGVLLLLQRLVHTDTRWAAKYDTLRRVFLPKLEETELLESWNEDLVRPRVDDGADLEAELTKEAREFDELLRRLDPRLGEPIGTLLADDRRRSEAIRLVSAERRQRADAEVRGDSAGDPP